MTGKGYAYGGDRQQQSDPASRAVWTLWGVRLELPEGPRGTGETDEEAVLREVRKETGVVARIVARIPGLPRRHHAERVPLDAPDRRGKPARSRNRQRSVCYAR